MKSPLILAGALALPMFCSAAIAGDESTSFRALNGLDGAAVAAMTNDQLATVEGGTALQFARARGGDGGAGGLGVNVGVNALNCIAANCTGGSGSQNQNAGNGGNGGGAIAINKY